MDRVEMKPEMSIPMTQNAAPERIIVRDPAECPTCVSGVDPTIDSGLFQEALREGL
jgi:hypothetical protein